MGSRRGFLTAAVYGAAGGIGSVISGLIWPRKAAEAAIEAMPGPAVHPLEAICADCDRIRRAGATSWGHGDTMSSHHGTVRPDGVVRWQAYEYHKGAALPVGTRLEVIDPVRIDADGRVRRLSEMSEGEFYGR